MSYIHPTAIIDPTAEIGADVSIGPYCVIGPSVRIGASTVLDSHVTIQKWTTVGERCRISAHVSIGTDAQDLKYKGEPTYLQIGDDTLIREFVTINRGTPGGHVTTKLGSRNLLMAYSHVAHDCWVGDDVIMANAATLAGHVTVGSHSTVGAFCAVHQFCRVGTYAFIGGFSVITRDALPFIKTVGDRNQAKIYGINALGLQRKNFSEETIEELKRLYRILFRSQLNTGEALTRARETVWNSPEAKVLMDFIESSERGIVK